MILASILYIGLDLEILIPDISFLISFIVVHLKVNLGIFSMKLFNFYYTRVIFIPFDSLINMIINININS